MRQISRIVLAAAIVSALVGPWATAQVTAEGEQSSVTLLRTADRIAAKEAYDEALIQLVGQSAFLHDLGEVDALAGKDSAFRLEEIPPGFALAMFVAPKSGDGKFTPDPAFQVKKVAVTLQESQSGRTTRTLKGIDEEQIGQWNFPVPSPAGEDQLHYPVLLTREGATYVITVDSQAQAIGGRELHFFLIAHPIVPGGLSSGENSSECEHVVDHGTYRDRDFARRPSLLTKTPSGASVLELGPIDLTSSTRHRFEIRDIPNLPHTIGFIANSQEELADAGVKQVHIYLRVKEGPVVINREFDVKDRKVSRTTGAPDLAHFSQPDSHDWKLVPNTAVGSTFAPKRGNVYILEITVTGVNDKQSEGKSIGVMLRS